MEDNRDWKYETDVHAYVKHIGSWTAEVGQDRGGNWSALIISGTRTHFGGYYASMAEAIAWCEKQIAEFIAADRRVKDGEAGT